MNITDTNWEFDFGDIETFKKWKEFEEIWEGEGDYQRSKDSE